MRHGIQITVRVALFCLVGACAADEPMLVVEIPQSQPSSPELGTIVRIHAHGGDAVKMSIEGGRIKVAGNGADDVEACVHLREGTSSPISVAVRPDDGEGLLGVVLYEYLADAGMDCSGHVLDSLQIAIRGPAGGPAIDAGGGDASVVDASPPDAATLPDASPSDSGVTSVAVQGGV